MVVHHEVVGREAVGLNWAERHDQVVHRKAVAVPKAEVHHDVAVGEHLDLDAGEEHLLQDA